MLLIPEGRDITDRYERDRQLDVLSRVLRHNFRNDVTVILGHASMAIDSANSAVTENAKQIERTVNNLSEQVEGYSETVSLLSDPPKRRPVSLTDLLSSVVDDAREAAPEGEISLSMPSEAGIQAVPSIDQALAEVINNAVEHAGPSPEVCVSIAEEADVVSVTVADDGPGMLEQEARVLTGEQSPTPLDHSSGIGLWRVYWLCDLSETDIITDTTDGTSITITFESAQ